MAELVGLNSQYYFDPVTNKPIALGTVFVGEVDLDPAIEANRKTITLIEEDGTIVPILPAAQPLSINAGGGITVNGSPSRAFIDGNYSIKVLRNDGTQAYFIANAFSQPVSSVNQQVIDLTITIGTLSFPTASAGFTIVTNSYDSAVTQGSGAEFVFTGTTTGGKAGNVPDADGFFYDADGKQFSVVGEINVLNFGAVGDGVTDDSTAVLIAVTAALVDKRPTHFPPGTFLMSVVLPSITTLIGAGSSYYTNNTTNSPTILLRPGAAVHVLDVSNKQYITLRDLDIDGNSGELASGNFGIKADSAGTMNFLRIKVLRCDTGIGASNSGVPLSVVMRTCVIRNNGDGLKFILDSSILGTTFSANIRTGINLNNGQIRIQECFLEFQKDGSLSAHAIFMDRNTNEVLITGNVFDRNAGNSVRIISSAGIIPRNILIASNQFKGCAWGSDLSNSERVSIYATSNIREISIIGNTFEARVSFPSGVEGAISPINAVRLDIPSNAVLLGNSTDAVLNSHELDYAQLAWTLSGSGTDEYYLVDTFNASGDALLPPPDFVDNDGVTIVSGTVGSLAVDEFDFADNDSLGFSTLYVRLTGGADPDTITPKLRPVYDSDIFDIGAPTGVTTEGFRDTTDRFSVGPASTEVVKLLTRGVRPPTFRETALKIEMIGDETTSGASSFAIFPFVVSRNGALGDINILEGNIQDYKTGFTVGWGGDATVLELTVTSSTLGHELSVSVENTGANTLNLALNLLW